MRSFDFRCFPQGVPGVAILPQNYFPYTSYLATKYNPGRISSMPGAFLLLACHKIYLAINLPCHKIILPSFFDLLAINLSCHHCSFSSSLAINLIWVILALCSVHFILPQP